MPEKQNSFLHPVIKHRNMDLRFPMGFCIAVAVFFVAVQAMALHLMGHPFASTTHSLMVWAGEVLSSENSQHLTDWYTFSHIIHGFIFYAILRWLFPWMTFWQRFALAVGIEAAWEIAENTPMVIDHYRQQALAQGYTGDSVINSVFDTLAMIAGFFFAWRAPVMLTVSIALFFEVLVGLSIHDNLTLNVIGMFWTPDFIANWQSQ